MNKFGSISMLAAAAVLASSALGFAASRAQLPAAKARVSLAQARGIALRIVPGTIASEELETEKGGSGRRYSFDVKTAKGIREVGIDASTGKVLENAAENDGK